MPRQRPLPYMSGNFDNPSASSDHESADRIARDILDPSFTAQSVSPSGELYRAIARYHNRRRGNRPSGWRMSSPEREAERRRRTVTTGSEDQSPTFGSTPASEQENQSTETPRERLIGRLMRRNRASAMGERRVRMSNGFRDPDAAASSLADLQNAGRQLEEAHESLRALLNRPMPRLTTRPDSRFGPVRPPPPPRSDDQESGEAAHNQRAKRRKLESDSPSPEFSGFRYGKYGQVEPGKLKMEIVSCDGGIFQEHTSPTGGNYAAENILKNDDTVYCTKSNRCNLVLRHQGGTVFSLKELIIKAPHSGYTAPVQEGMVFISMTSDDLLTRTTQYQIQYSPPRNRDSRAERSSELPSIMSVRRNHEGSAQARVGRLYDIGVQDEECDFRTAQIPPDFASNSQPFNVTTECSDSEDDENTRRSTYHSRSTTQLYNPYAESTSSDSENSSNSLIGVPRRYRPSRILRMREITTNIALAAAAEASQIATQEAVQAVGGELMVPHARFFIERDKSKCTIRFEPEVSGRFILLKMWSPHCSEGSNIDVQSVVAMGFAGPRFMPDVQLR